MGRFDTFFLYLCTVTLAIVALWLWGEDFITLNLRESPRVIRVEGFLLFIFGSAPMLASVVMGMTIWQVKHNQPRVKTLQIIIWFIAIACVILPIILSKRVMP